MLALGIIAIVINAIIGLLWICEGCAEEEPLSGIIGSLCNVLSIIYIALSL